MSCLKCNKKMNVNTKQLSLISFVTFGESISVLERW